MRQLIYSKVAMMLWLLANRKLLLYSLAALLLSLMVWKISDWRQKASQLDQAKADLASEIKGCKDNQIFTKDSSHELQANLSAINTGYLSLLAQNEPCTAAKPGRGHDGPPSANKPLELEQRRLNDEQAARLISCQKTITYIYTTNGREDLLPK